MFWAYHCLGDTGEVEGGGEMIVRGPGGVGGQLTGKARARCGPWASFRSWDHSLLPAEMAQRRGLVEVVGGCWEGVSRRGAEVLEW